MRRRKVKGALDKYLSYEDYIIEGEDNDEILSQILEFTKDKDLELELGSGSTVFLIEHAMNNPDKVYIAIEYKEELLLKACRNAESKNLKNIKFLRHWIEKLESVFDEIQTSKIYLNFSDPWPKARHAKRRLTHHNYLNLYKKIMKNGGEIEFKTDNTDMFDFSVEEFETYGFNILDITRDLHAEKENIIMTEYEKKFIEQGKKIKYVRVSYEK